MLGKSLIFYFIINIHIEIFLIYISKYAHFIFSVAFSIFAIVLTAYR